MASLSRIWAEVRGTWSRIPKTERSILNLAGRDGGVTRGVLINRIAPKNKDQLDRLNATIERMLASGDISSEKRQHGRNRTEFTIYRASWRALEQEGCERIFDITKMQVGERMAFVIPYRGDRLMDHIGVAVRSAELNSKPWAFEFSLDDSKKIVTIKRVK